MSDRPQTRRRTALGYWLPLAVTLAAVTVGIAAWIWSEREDSPNDDDGDSDFSYPPSGNRSGVGAGESEIELSRSVPAIELHDTESGQTSPQDTLYARVTDVVRRTPSPQQLIGDTGRRVAAGVAAAGARFGLGKTLDFRDHERWQEEVELKAAAALVSQDQEDVGVRRVPVVKEHAPVNTGDMLAHVQVQTGGKDKRSSKRKLVAVVVSSVLPADENHDEGSSLEILNNFASMTGSLSHEFVILIYAPHLKTYPTALIDDADVPFEDSTVIENKYYDELESLAVQIVPHPAHIIPFTTPTSHVHLLRHLLPNLAYVQEQLAGNESEHALQAKSWVGRMVLIMRDDNIAHAEKKNGLQCTRISDLVEQFETTK